MADVAVPLFRSFVFVLLSATALVKLRFPQLLPLSRQTSCESDLFLFDFFLYCLKNQPKIRLSFFADEQKKHAKRLLFNISRKNT